jgi:hypothetical protein
VVLVLDPHLGRVLGVEDEQGNSLGEATPLDRVANTQRRRHKPRPTTSATHSVTPNALNAVELAYRQYHRITTGDEEEGR